VLSRGGIHCDWIECYCPIPEGKYVGEFMVLLPFQREFIYQIYNNLGDGSFITPEVELKVLERLLTDRDRDALELAMEQCRTLEKRARQLDKILEQRPRQRTAMLAAFICQCRNLELKPGDTAPCWVINPDKDERSAAKLVRKLLKAGVSQCHPDPMRALKEANGRSAD
jgi:hypothetical protein